MISWWLVSLISHYLLVILLQSEVLASNHVVSHGYEDFYTYFIAESVKHEGNYEMDNSPSGIPWLDINLLDKGANFYEKNFLGAAGAFMWALNEVLAMKTFSSVPASTGSLLTDTRAYHRMLKTLLHVDNWCKAGSKMFDLESDAEKSFRTVRKRHQSAVYIAHETDRSLKGISLLDKDLIETNKDRNMLENLLVAFKADLAFVDTSESPLHLLVWNSSNPVGQFDLGVAQFILYSHVVMTPEIFGVLNASPDDFIAYVHMWAVIGRKLGIEDRFNVALNLKPEDYERFYRNIVVAGLKTVDIHNVNYMSKGMGLTAKNFLIPSFLRLRCWMYYVMINTLLGFQGYNLQRQFDLEDLVCLIYLPLFEQPQIPFRIPALNSLSTLVFKSWFTQELKSNSIKD